MMKPALWIAALLLALYAPWSYAESQGPTDYKGVSDPFGDPSNYEFAEDEREDKEFFHLGRYLMVGLDGGVGVFTGGLGTTADPGPYGGIRIIYFFDRALAFEVGVHYALHNEILLGPSPANITYAQIENTLIPVTMGFRYYFDTQNAPRAIALANPYLALGPGLYLNRENVVEQNPGVSLSSGETSNFGAYAGGGVEFLIYRKHVYFGFDLRYHFIFFLSAGPYDFGDAQFDRSGGYFSSSVSLTYNF